MHNIVYTSLLVDCFIFCDSSCVSYWAVLGLLSRTFVHECIFDLIAPVISHFIGWEHSGRFWYRTTRIDCSFTKDGWPKVSAEGMFFLCLCMWKYVVHHSCVWTCHLMFDILQISANYSYSYALRGYFEDQKCSGSNQSIVHFSFWRMICSGEWILLMVANWCFRLRK